MFFFTITILNREIKRKNESKKNIDFWKQKIGQKFAILAPSLQFLLFTHTFHFSIFDFYLLLIVNAFLFYFCTSKLICVRVNMVCVCVIILKWIEIRNKQTCAFFSLSKRKKPRNKIYVYKNTVSHTHLLNHFGSFVLFFFNALLFLDGEFLANLVWKKKIFFQHKLKRTNEKEKNLFQEIFFSLNVCVCVCVWSIIIKFLH